MRASMPDAYRVNDGYHTDYGAVSGKLAQAMLSNGPANRNPANAVCRCPRNRA